MMIIIVQDWVGKVIDWELCKKLKFDYTNKWYMHNPESVLKNEMHRLLWEFDTEIGHIISAKQPDWMIVKKKKHLPNGGLCCLSRVKIKEGDNMDKYMTLVRELKDLWIMKVTVIPIVIGALGTIPKG